MSKAQFSEILHQARSNKGMSLRQLSAETGIEYTRLSRMEHGTRPAPGLPQMRRLAERLSLNLVDLLVSAGTPREAVEQLLWVERLQQAKRMANLADYSPEGHRARAKNEVVASILSREGAFCTAMIGSEMWYLLAFSDADTVKVTIPPEAIQVFLENPRDIILPPCNVFPARVLKPRNAGRLLNLVLEVGGIELNALALSDSGQDMELVPGGEVFVTISPVALSTEPMRQEEGKS